MHAQGTTPSASAREALEPALTAYFAAQQLEAKSMAFFHASVPPTLVLWVNAWHSLPELVTWFAVLAWGGSVAVAASLTLLSWQCRLRLAATLPDARRVVRLRFASGDPIPPSSSLCLFLALGAAAVLWVHGLAPSLVSPEVVMLSGRAWILLMAATLGNLWLERSF